MGVKKGFRTCDGLHQVPEYQIIPSGDLSPAMLILTSFMHDLRRRDAQGFLTKMADRKGFEPSIYVSLRLEIIVFEGFSETTGNGKMPRWVQIWFKRGERAGGALNQLLASASVIALW